MIVIVITSFFCCLVLWRIVDIDIDHRNKKKTMAIKIINTCCANLATYRYNHVPWKGCLDFCTIMDALYGLLDTTDSHPIRNPLLAAVEKLLSVKLDEKITHGLWHWLLDLYFLESSFMCQEYIHPWILQLHQNESLKDKLFADLWKKLDTSSSNEVWLMYANLLLRAHSTILLKSKKKSIIAHYKENATINFKSWMLTLRDPVRWYRSALMNRVQWEAQLEPFRALNYRLAWRDTSLQAKLNEIYKAGIVAYGAMGAFESHLIMWKTHAELSSECVVKYSEDDMVPDTLYGTVLNTLLDILCCKQNDANQNKSDTDCVFDLIWIGYHLPLAERSEAMLKPTSRMLINGPPYCPIGGMFGYIIPSRNSARKLLDLFAKTPKPMHVGVDTWIMQLNSEKFRQAHLNKPILFSQYFDENQPQTQRSDCGPTWNHYPVDDRI